MMILHGVNGQKPYVLGYATQSTPKKGGFTMPAPTLELTTFLRVDFPPPYGGVCTGGKSVLLSSFQTAGNPPPLPRARRHGRFSLHPFMVCTGTCVPWAFLHDGVLDDVAQWCTMPHEMYSLAPRSFYGWINQWTSPTHTLMRPWSRRGKCRSLLSSRHRTLLVLGLGPHGTARCKGDGPPEYTPRGIPPSTLLLRPLSLLGTPKGCLRKARHSCGSRPGHPPALWLR